MLTLPGTPPYRRENVLVGLDKIFSSRWFMSKAKRKAAAEARNEIAVLRKRIQYLAVEVSEWRWKVGGSAYRRHGPEFMAMVARGMKDRGYDPVGMSDDDFKG